MTHGNSDKCYPRILRCGDSALAVEFSDAISEDANSAVLALDATLLEIPIQGVLETIPTYRSLTVVYDPEVTRGKALASLMLERAAQLQQVTQQGRHFEIPVHYGGDHQGDLDELAEMKGLSVDELIKLHIDAEYRVFMIGFAPGFAYLGGLPEILQTPRLSVPRQRIEAGAIGIGGRQSSINSVPSPSGWRFIGRTPFKLFDLKRDNAFLLKAGDRIRFKQVTEEEAHELDALIAENRAEPLEIEP